MKNFFYNHLGNYSTEEVHHALKDLEKEINEGLRNKVRALRKEFEKREGISRKKKYGLLTLGILGLGALAGCYAIYISQQKESHRIEQLKGAGLSEEQARSFDSAYSKYAQETLFASSYNQTILDFARHFGKNPDLAAGAFNIYSNFNRTNNFLDFAMDKPLSLEFLRKYPELVRTLNFEASLLLHSRNSTIFDELYRNISKDPRVTGDRNKLTELTSQLFLDLGYTGKVRVLIPGTNEYREEHLRKEVIQSSIECIIATHQRNYPMLPREAFFKLGNATQNNPEIVNFSSVILIELNGEKVDLWEDLNRVDSLHYTLALDLMQSPHVLHKPESFEFLNGLHRQHDFVLDKLGLDPANQTIRLTYVKPDIDYYYLFLPNKRMVVNGTEITFPLLPLLNGTKMKEWFPSLEDRMVIYACQYPIQLTYFNAKTGELNQPHIRQPKTLLDNLELTWEGWKWGNFEGKLIDRIIRAYTDKEWKSYDPETMEWSWARDLSDYEAARSIWRIWELGALGSVYEDFKDSDKVFISDYDPILAKDLVTDLGFRFIGGLALYDNDNNYQPPLPHQYRPFLYVLYSKALGYGGIKVLAENPSYPFYHESMAGAVPKYLLDQLPSDGRYAPGNMISRYAYGYDTNRRPLIIISLLPTDKEINF